MNHERQGVADPEPNLHPLISVISFSVTISGVGVGRVPAHKDGAIGSQLVVLVIQNLVGVFQLDGASGGDGVLTVCILYIRASSA